MTIGDLNQKPENWEYWDRDKLIKLVEKLPDSTRIGISHTTLQTYSVYRVWESRSIHLRFEDRAGEPRCVVLTEIDDSATRITWISGRLRAWIDALEINRDELLETLL